MANLTITTTANTIKVDFGTYPTHDGMIQGCWQKQNITFKNQATQVAATVQNEREWYVSVVPTDNCLVVDTVNGVAPTDINDLYDKLIALIA